MREVRERVNEFRSLIFYGKFFCSKKKYRGYVGEVMLLRSVRESVGVS